MTLACRVLIADDDPAIASVVRRFFERRGATCVMASDGEIAGSLLRGADAFDVALFDVTMPRGGGYELLPVARETHPATKVILMSGHPQEGAQHQPDAYLEKPFSSKSLESILARLL